MAVEDIVKIASDSFSGLGLIANGKLARLKNNAVFFNSPLKKIWVSPYSDLGSQKSKLLKKICFNLYGKMSLTVQTEKETRKIKLSGKGARRLLLI
jgi:hypothetical protein